MTRMDIFLDFVFLTLKCLFVCLCGLVVIFILLAPVLVIVAAIKIILT